MAGLSQRAQIGVLVVLLLSITTWVGHCLDVQAEVEGKARQSDERVSFTTEDVVPGLGHRRNEHDPSGDQPGLPPAGAEYTVAGSVFCSSCSPLDSTPMFGSETILLCPHPAPGHGGRRARDPLVAVASSLTGNDGSFHLAVNGTFRNILDRCVVAINPNVKSKCQLPPHSGHTFPLSTLESSTLSMDERGARAYALKTLPFHPAQQPHYCSGSATANAKRSLLHAQIDVTSHSEDVQTPELRRPKRQTHEARKHSMIPKRVHHHSGAHTKTNSRRLLQIPTIPQIPPIPPIPPIAPIPPIPPVLSSSSCSIAP